MRESETTVTFSDSKYRGSIVNCYMHHFFLMWRPTYSKSGAAQTSITIKQAVRGPYEG